MDVKQHFINDILPSRRKVPESDARSVRIVSARLFFSTMLKTLFADLARQAPTRESTHKGVNQRSKYVTQVQQQRPESPRVTLTWHACKYKIHKLHQRYILCLQEKLVFDFNVLSTPGWSKCRLIRKCTFQNPSHYNVNPFSGQINKISPYIK